MDAAVEVAVARKHGGGVEVARDDLALNHGVERARHAVAGGAGKGDHAEPELLEFLGEAGFVEVKGDGLGAGRQRSLDPGLASESGPIGIASQQAGCDHIARVAGVGAAGDCGNDHRAVGHLACDIVPLSGDALGREVGGRHPCMRIGRAGHVADHRRQVEVQGALVLRGLEAVGPQPGVAGKVFDQLHLRIIAPGECEVVNGLLVDEEHRRGGAILGRHVGDGGAIAQRQCRGAFASKLEPGANNFLFSQELGHRQHHIGGGDAGTRLAAELDAHDIGQPHPGGAPEHDILGFKAAHTNRDHAECVDMRRVAVGTDAGIRKRDAITHLDHRRHFLQIDLMHDAVARRDHIDILEGRFGPVDEMKAVFIATILDRAVFCEGIGVEAAALHRQRVVDDQLNRHDRVDLGRITALIGNRVAKTGEIDQRGLPEDVVADNSCRKPREIEVALAIDQLAQRVGEHAWLAAANQIFGQHARGIGQGVISAGPDRIDRRAGVEIVEGGAGQAGAVGGLHSG